MRKYLLLIFVLAIVVIAVMVLKTRSSFFKKLIPDSHLVVTDDSVNQKGERQTYVREKYMVIGFGEDDSLLGFYDPTRGSLPEGVYVPGPEFGAPIEEGPGPIAYAPNGDIYIIDKVKERIVKYDSTGHYLGIVCDVDFPITVTTTSGKQIEFRGCKGGCDIEIDKHGNIYVVGGRVYIFDKHNHLKTIVDRFNNLEGIRPTIFAGSFGDGILAGVRGFSDHLGRRIELFPDGSTGKLGLTFWRDYQGNIYEIPDSIVVKQSRGEIPHNQRWQIIVRTDAITKEKEIVTIDTTKEAFREKRFVHILGIDGEGSLYFSTGAKYNFNGNRLSFISATRTSVTKEYNLNVLLSGTERKVLENGNMMDTYCTADSFYIFRYRRVEIE